MSAVLSIHNRHQLAQQMLIIISLFSKFGFQLVNLTVDGSGQFQLLAAFIDLLVQGINLCLLLLHGLDQDGDEGTVIDGQVFFTGTAMLVIALLWRTVAGIQVSLNEFRIDFLQFLGNQSELIACRQMQIPSSFILTVLINDRH